MRTAVGRRPGDLCRGNRSWSRAALVAIENSSKRPGTAERQEAPSRETPRPTRRSISIHAIRTHRVPIEDVPIRKTDPALIRYAVELVLAWE
jgi:hypothetical protein